VISGWWQLAAWTPRLLLAMGVLLAVLVVVQIARIVIEVFRR
jgi:hypothetical protein